MSETLEEVPEENQIMLITVVIPLIKKDKKRIKLKNWIVKEYVKYLKTNSTVYTKTQIHDILKQKYKKWVKTEQYTFPLEVTYKQALNAMVAHNMEESWNESYKPVEPMLPSCYYRNKTDVSSDFVCSICLNSNTDDVYVQLRKCKCIFHKKCIRKAHTFNKRCPTCNRFMSRISKEPVC